MSGRCHSCFIWALGWAFACGEVDAVLYCRSDCGAHTPIALEQEVTVCGSITECGWGDDPEHGACSEPQAIVQLQVEGVPCTPVESEWSHCVSCLPEETGELELRAQLRDPDGELHASKSFGPMQVVVPSYELHCFKLMDDFRRLCSVPGEPERIEVVVEAAFEGRVVSVSPEVTSSWDALSFTHLSTNTVVAGVDYADTPPPAEPIELQVSHANWSAVVSVEP